MPHDLSRASRLRGNQSRKYEEKKRTKHILVIALAVVSIFTWGFTLSRLSYVGFTQIKGITVEGADSDIISSIQAAAWKAMEGEFFGLFSKSNSLFYPVNDVVESVAESSPRILKVEVDKSNLNQLVVKVAEREPKAIICPTLPDFVGSKLDVGATDTCYLADKDAFIFKAIDGTFNLPLNRYYAPAIAEAMTSTSTVLGQFATSTEEFTKLQNFYDSLRPNGIEPLGLLINDNGEYELYAKPLNTLMNEAGNTIVIYFNRTRSFEEQLLNLTSFWKNMIQKGGVKDPDYDYIDVRYGSNVFYKKIHSE